MQPEIRKSPRSEVRGVECVQVLIMHNVEVRLENIFEIAWWYVVRLLGWVVGVTYENEKNLLIYYTLHWLYLVVNYF